MTVKYSSHSLEPDMYQDVIFELNEISQCPRCKSFISPIFLFSAFKRYRIDSMSFAKIDCFLFCPKCEHVFISSCVHQYLNDPSVNSLVEKAMWLGNDEAHYVRKHTDRDTNDLKTFITAATHFITLRLTVEDANSIVSQK